MTSTSSAHLTCLCGSISEPGTLLSSEELPTKSEICHCNSCRLRTGTLTPSFPELNSSPSESTLSKLTAYQSSLKITDYFCSTCGCKCFCINHRSKKWFCLGGIIEPSPASTTSWPKDVVKVSNHDFVLDTIDGGLVPFMLACNGGPIPTWKAESKSGAPFDLPHADILSLPTKSIKDLPPPKADSFLTAKCHCSGVFFLIKRANYDINSHLGVPATLTPLDYTKYKAFPCACRSCRLSTGVSLVPYALIPPANIFNANSPTSSSPVIFGHDVSRPNINLGLTLKHHWSSPDVCRSFCGQCGATVTYWCAGRPDVVSLAVGILKAEEGSMARLWLEWEWGRCSAAVECVDEKMLQAWLGSKEAMGNLGG